MCGIVGAVSQRNVSSILIEGLRRLEYRGYDSAGIALINQNGMERFRALGKVQQLANKVSPDQVGNTGIAHTRWATHGAPSESNAHPHFSRGRIAVVHNGIIENHKDIREELLAQGFVFESETDTEVIAHLVNHCFEGDLYQAVFKAVARLRGAFGLAIIAVDDPDTLVACRRGSPLVLGVGINENFIASDVTALLAVTNRFIYLEEGDFAVINRHHYQVYDQSGNSKQPDINQTELSADPIHKGNYRHYMLKEIHEQPRAIADCLEGRIADGRVLDTIFGHDARAIFKRTRQIQIVACGTSYHAGFVARYWIEAILGIPCQVEIASEFRYRQSVVPGDTLFVTLSQSGETADTLAALRNLSMGDYCGSLSICNVFESSLVRESNLVLMTRAGSEIGVASTKAFSTQLVALLILTVAIGQVHGVDSDKLIDIVRELSELPDQLDKLLLLDKSIESIAADFIDKQHVLFLGRGVHYPIVMEGALKLKEISYIHAEAYPAGELKHGPIALVDTNMPVVIVMPNDELLEKLHANLQEVKARGAQLYLFAHRGSEADSIEGAVVVEIDSATHWTAPILSTIPLQLLSYYVAVQRGTDVDQPRNLAKSVTVE